MTKWPFAAAATLDWSDLVPGALLVGGGFAIGWFLVRRPKLRALTFWLLVAGVQSYIVYRQWLSPEITIAHPTGPESNWDVRLPFELTNSGALAATHVVYRCRFFQVYDLERGIKYAPADKLVWRKRGAVAGNKGASVTCDLPWDAPRPAAVDVAVTVRYYAASHQLQATQRFCLIPGPDGHAAWAATEGACEFRGSAEVAAIEEKSH